MFLADLGLLLIYIGRVVVQVTDYAIARRIIDLHSRLEESVERLYSVVSFKSYLRLHEIVSLYK